APLHPHTPSARGVLMPTKTSTEGRSYEIDGRKFVWRPEDDDGVTGNLPDVRIPLRLMLGLVLDLADGDSLDAKIMAQMLERLIPNQMDVLREMDLNDFQDMFTTWQTEYTQLSGASLGEFSGSSA
ncbi:MAG: hypothetical protein ACRED4_03240, partial [Brevundimonas sp.]